ncbi:hypothetical protein I6N95_22715 [Vagococcus sp. BWB3-3]|uniref:Uncharacterized protein n=1 Tax=Vagococcus allomyrinae TaxID=2794353 RepID=A0A940PD20_9ENTE|nr:hypothetical protein [Vagococcus allomyrinae]MBP1043846.1 hypothetical protein [Vagococcus allomyrinae]
MKVKIFIVILAISLIGIGGYSISQYSKINTLLSENKKLEEQIKKDTQAFTSEQNKSDVAFKELYDATTLEIKELKATQKNNKKTLNLLTK